MTEERIGTNNWKSEARILCEEPGSNPYDIATHLIDKINATERSMCGEELSEDAKDNLHTAITAYIEQYMLNEGYEF